MSPGGETREAQALASWLAADFPDDCEALLGLCVNGVGFPVGYYHPELLLDALTATLPDGAVDQLRVPYVYLSAYYFALDAVVDRQAPDPLQTTYLTHLLGVAAIRFRGFVAAWCPEESARFDAAFRSRISANAAAVREEQSLAASPLAVDPAAERRSTIGRSNSFLLLLDLLQLATGIAAPNSLLCNLDDFLYFMQMGDDLGDWREDLRGGRSTPLLRWCAGQFGQLPTEDQLEEFLYLSGAYELKAAEILNAFEDIEKALPLSATRMRRFVAAQRERLHSVLRSFVEVKLDHGAA